MTRLLRRGSLPLLTTMSALLIAAAAFSVAPASAGTTIPINWNVNATTHIKSLNMDVVVPQGTFDGVFDIADGSLTGNLSLPPATKSIDLFGMPIASTTFAMTQNGPITGHVDLATMTATVNTSFNFAITKATLTWFPWLNLVGSTCRGSAPINVTLSGPVSLTGTSTFNATYTLPPLTGCGILTSILNLIIPGPGNTFSASFGPAT